MQKLPPIEYAAKDFVGQVNGVQELFVCETDTPIKKVVLHNNFNDLILDYHWHVENGVLMVAVAKPLEPTQTGAIV